ncbi:MAG: hypothetical protein RL375_664 [Pseudomonadota bacterium]|jgi:hypothetical protein
MDVTEDALIDEILKCPGTEQRTPVPAVVRPASYQADNDEKFSGFYDSSYDLLAGLSVIERKVPAKLCAAVFPPDWRHHKRR